MILKYNNKVLLSKNAVVNNFSLDEMTIAYISGFTKTLTTQHVKLIDSFVKRTKSILLKADVVYLMNVNNTVDSFRNLVKDSHHGTINGSNLVFDEYWGWSNPSGDTLINTNYNPYTDGINYQRDNAAYACYIQGSNQPAEVQYVMGSFQSTAIRTSFNVNTVVATVNYVINDGANNSVGEVAFMSGYNYGSRESSTTKKFRNRNILDATNSVTSSNVPNVNWYLFGLGISSISYPKYTGNLSFVYIGASLTEDENRILDDAVNDYLIQCLFLKYGQDNWGVKMAKSYFLELHNFEKYEAWEVYEFIKRHQSDYIPEMIINSGNMDTTDWIDSNGDGLGDYFTIVGDLTPTIVTGNGFNGNAQRFECNNSGNAHSFASQTYLEMGINEYVLSFKYRSNVQWSIGNFLYVNNIPINTGDAVEVSYRLTSLEIVVPSRFRLFYETSGQIGSWVEIDELSLKLTTGYEYKTFSGKTVADYILLFKAGGNLNSNIWRKTSDVLRWNQDGIITINNTMPAYTRSGNLGIVTVTTTDSFNNVTTINLTQTNSSVNSFYGNFPQFEKLKTTSFIYLYGRQNRIKFNFLNGNLIHRSFLFTNITYSGYVKINLNKYVGAGLNDYFAISNPSKETKVYGNMSLYTNEFNSGRELVITGLALNILDLNGTLNNWIYQGTYTLINIQYTNLTGGLLNWHKNLATVILANNYFTTEAVDAQLKAINDYFTTTTPTNNLALNLRGANMGIPTGGASNSDLLGIVAKHSAAGFTATITVRTV